MSIKKEHIDLYIMTLRNWLRKHIKKRYSLNGLTIFGKNVILISKNSSLKCGNKCFFNISMEKNPSIFSSVLKIEDNSSISFGNNVKVYDNAKIVIWNGGQINIGDNISILNNCQIEIVDSLSIDNDCLIAADCVIRDHDGHKIDSKKRADAVVIEKHVWIGQRVTILKGVTIGEGSMIGAGSVVTKSIPPHSLAAGNPAKIIRENITWEK